MTDPGAAAAPGRPRADERRPGPAGGPGAALDGWPDPSANVVHVGPIAEEAVPLPWVPPWADGEAIASPALRDGARRMAGVPAACGGASAASDEVEEVARRPALRQPALR